VVAIETGYTENNEWVDWQIFTAHKTGPKQDCLACAAARPSLGTVPLPLHPNIDSIRAIRALRVSYSCL